MVALHMPRVRSTLCTIPCMLRLLLHFLDFTQSNLRALPPDFSDPFLLFFQFESATPLPRKRRVSTHSELVFLSSLTAPLITKLSFRAQKRPARVREPAFTPKNSPAAPSFDKMHTLFTSMLHRSPFLRPPPCPYIKPQLLLRHLSSRVQPPPRALPVTLCLSLPPSCS